LLHAPIVNFFLLQQLLPPYLHIYFNSCIHSLLHLIIITQEEKRRKNIIALTVGNP
jgi:hypothetical protein